MITVSTRTLANALAYVAITGSKRNLHINTHIAIGRFTEFNIQKFSAHYTVSAEGMDIARKSPLWRAHERLLSLGFQVTNRFKNTPRFIHYAHPELVKDARGREVKRTAFTGRHGRTYVQPADGSYRHEEVR